MDMKIELIIILLVVNIVMLGSLVMYSAMIGPITPIYLVISATCGFVLFSLLLWEAFKNRTDQQSQD
jgi:UPF0716 family protein affecting phage T7 exclusion